MDPVPSPAPSSATVSPAATAGKVAAVYPRAWVADTFGEPLREIVSAALAGLVAGVVVLGLAGRVVMRAATLLDPDAVGRLTENGNRIGDITFEGTLALVLFGGVLSGLGGAIVWIAVSRWLPQRPVWRALLAMPVAVALSGFLLVEGDNRDFRILDAQLPIIALLLGLIALFGGALALSDDWFLRRLPPVRAERLRTAAAYGVLVGLGAVLILPLIVGLYFSTEVCFCRPERPTGTAIAVAGVATVVFWILRARGSEPRPRWLAAIGRVAVVAAVILGGLRLVEEIRVIALV